MCTYVAIITSLCSTRPIPDAAPIPAATRPIPAAVWPLPSTPLSPSPCPSPCPYLPSVRRLLAAVRLAVCDGHAVNPDAPPPNYRYLQPQPKPYLQPQSCPHSWVPPLTNLQPQPPASAPAQPHFSAPPRSYLQPQTLSSSAGSVPPLTQPPAPASGLSLSPAAAVFSSLAAGQQTGERPCPTAPPLCPS